MALSREHELHTRRRGRNVGTGILLASFIALIFALTFVKVTSEYFQVPSMNSEVTQ